MKIDLHLHSTYSDGKLKPAEVVKKLAKKGIKIASLTDHDNIDGTLEFNKAAKKFGISVLNGVEISSYQNGIGLHILGLGIDVKNKLLLKIFARQIKERRISFIKTIKCFKKAGLFVNLKKFNYFKKIKTLSKPLVFDLIWNQLQNHKIFKRKFGFENHSIAGRPPWSSFIDTFMNKHGQLAYVKKSGISCNEAIKAIHKDGGLAVLAHPGIEIEFTEKKANIENIIKKLIGFGLDGLEVFSVALAKRKKINYFHKIAQKYKLLETIGSDDHDGSSIGKVKVSTKKEKDLINFLKRKKHLSVL